MGAHVKSMSTHWRHWQSVLRGVAAVGLPLLHRSAPAAVRLRGEPRESLVLRVELGNLLLQQGGGCGLSGELLVTCSDSSAWHPLPPGHKLNAVHWPSDGYGAATVA